MAVRTPLGLQVCLKYYFSSGNFPGMMMRHASLNSTSESQYCDVAHEGNHIVSAMFWHSNPLQCMHPSWNPPPCTNHIRTHTGHFSLY